jgi:predicted RNA binding protein YcfA (HicA-like mRNA interferase family)
MSRKKKLLQRAQNNARNLRFQDFCTLMTYFGFDLVRERGSHRIYQHPNLPDVMNVQPKKDGKAKAYQVEQFLKLLDEHNLTLDDNEGES